jgi:DNA-binding protein Fis
MLEHKNKKLIATVREKTKIFLEKREERAVFRKCQGYEVYVRCRYCGDWTRGKDFCNKQHFRNYEAIKPQFAKEKLERNGLRKMIERYNKLCDAYDELFEMYQKLVPLKEIDGFLKTGASVDEVEKVMIIRAIRQHNYNYWKTAQTLGFTRRTLYNKLERYGLNKREKVRQLYG